MVHRQNTHSELLGVMAGPWSIVHRQNTRNGTAATVDGHEPGPRGYRPSTMDHRPSTMVYRSSAGTATKRNATTAPAPHAAMMAANGTAVPSPSAPTSAPAMAP